MSVLYADLMQFKSDILSSCLGTTAQATDAWPGPDDLFKWDWNQFSKYVITSLDSFAQGIGHEALRMYNASQHNGMVQELNFSSKISSNT
ncbi:hypothetical protein AVEN_226946-1 [Araneus ventricosus]|uniref:Uncharacterized protein n=1 Tax=Araneus ventricosus TaxID=182803 RepID=A0A4Y2JJC8_ARAVE|nr:hypothetical protein AVEN_226946-1 [Araneus ventricosus]